MNTYLIFLDFNVLCWLFPCKTKTFCCISAVYGFLSFKFMPQWIQQVHISPPPYRNYWKIQFWCCPWVGHLQAISQPAIKHFFFSKKRGKIRMPDIFTSRVICSPLIKVSVSICVIVSDLTRNSSGLWRKWLLSKCIYLLSRQAESKKALKKK